MGSAKILQVKIKNRTSQTTYRCHKTFGLRGSLRPGNYSFWDLGFGVWIFFPVPSFPANPVSFCLVLSRYVSFCLVMSRYVSLQEDEGAASAAAVLPRPGGDNDAGGCSAGSTAAPLFGKIQYNPRLRSFTDTLSVMSGVATFCLGAMMDAHSYPSRNLGERSSFCSNWRVCGRIET